MRYLNEANGILCCRGFHADAGREERVTRHDRSHSVTFSNGNVYHSKIPILVCTNPLLARFVAGSLIQR